MSRTLHGILAALVAWVLLVGAASAQELLEPDKAFRFSARALDPATIEIAYRIAPGYYLYRKNFKFELKEPAGAGDGVRFPRAFGGCCGGADDATLDKWLNNPERFLPGTGMTFPGLKLGKDRLRASRLSSAPGCKATARRSSLRRRVRSEASSSNHAHRQMEEIWTRLRALA